MRETFDRRVVPACILDFIRACQSRIDCHLGGGAALSGAYLGHRMTGDIDLFSHNWEEMRALVGLLPETAEASGVSVTILRDAGHLVRARVEAREAVTELDLVYEPIADIEPTPLPIEGIVVESLADLRANKLTCILSRSEPRDLVDLYYLDRAGFPPEMDLELALRKDAGIDPGILAWLLSRFPIRPLPKMLAPIAPGDLQKFRDDLAERLRGSVGV